MELNFCSSLVSPTMPSHFLVTDLHVQYHIQSIYLPHDVCEKRTVISQYEALILLSFTPSGTHFAEKKNHQAAPLKCKCSLHLATFAQIGQKKILILV